MPTSRREPAKASAGEINGQCPPKSLEGARAGKISELERPLASKQNGRARAPLSFFTLMAVTGTHEDEYYHKSVTWIHSEFGR